MKVSLRHLKRVINQLERECIHDENTADDVAVTVSITSADPGNGAIVATLNLETQSSAQSLERNDLISADVKIELFEKHEKMEPIIKIDMVKKLTR